MALIHEVSTVHCLHCEGPEGSHGDMPLLPLLYQGRQVPGGMSKCPERRSTFVSPITLPLVPSAWSNTAKGAGISPPLTHTNTPQNPPPQYLIQFHFLPELLRIFSVWFCFHWYKIQREESKVEFWSATTQVKKIIYILQITKLWLVIQNDAKRIKYIITVTYNCFA